MAIGVVARRLQLTPSVSRTRWRVDVTDIDGAIRALAHVVELGPPASMDDLSSAAIRLGYSIPPELAAFYLRANGTMDATPVENGWTSLWMVSKWKPVRELPLETQDYTECNEAIVVADYSLDSWWYAVDRRGAVYIVDGALPARVVAATFTAFIMMLIEDDARIYPLVEGAG